MAVKIRLARRGRKARAMYDVVVADVRAPRDGRFIEKIGTYNPNTDPATINIDDDRAFKWVMDGAQPTDTVRAMLSYRGVMMKKHLQVGVNKGAITQEAADKKFEAWLKEKEGKIAGKVDTLAKDKAASAKVRKEAETKVKEARAEALAQRVAEAEAAIKAEEAEAVAEEATENVEAPTTEEVAAEAPVAEKVVTEEPVAEVAKEEAPIAETKEEAPVAETKEEAPVAETKEEAPAAETKEEAPAAEATEEAAPEASTDSEEAPAEDKK